MKPILKLDSVSFEFDQQKIFDSISFSVFPGEILVLAGKSGSGKSILLKLIAGLLYPSSGTIYLNELLLSEKLKPADQKILSDYCAVVFQEGALLDEICVWENIGIRALENSDKSEEQIYAEVEKIALQTGFKTEDLHKFVWQLSGGMRKKAAIARAIFHQPELILYDEPTAGLDPAGADTIDQLILEIRRNTGAAALVLTHDLHSIQAIADRVVFLDQGRIGFEGTKTEFFNVQDEMILNFRGKRKVFPE